MFSGGRSQRAEVKEGGWGHRRGDGLASLVLPLIASVEDGALSTTPSRVYARDAPSDGSLSVSSDCRVYLVVKEGEERRLRLQLSHAANPSGVQPPSRNRPRPHDSQAGPVLNIKVRIVAAKS
jgi:hypothetical protein